MRDFYERFYALAPSSPAHAEFCRRAFGLDLCQHGFAGILQIEALLRATNLGPGQRALDLGCGTGQLAQLLANRTGAHLTGIDLIPEAIRQARERTTQQADRLAFREGDLNDLDLPARAFDVILSVDSFYFSRDYARTVGQLLEALRPGGRIGFLYTYGWEPSGPVEKFDRAELALEGTPLARALRANGLHYQAQDWTAVDCRNTILRGEILAELADELTAEGLGFVLDNRRGEVAGIRRACEIGLHRRWLYVARLPEPRDAVGQHATHLPTGATNPDPTPHSHPGGGLPAPHQLDATSAPLDLFVPGRICLFGEHTDWAGGHRRSNPALTRGYTLICGTEQGIYAHVHQHPRLLVLSATAPDGTVTGPYKIPMEPAALLADARAGGFWSYVAGTAYQVLARYPVAGLAIDNYRTDLPIRKGLSSSAAICVLAARAFNRLYGLGLDIRGEMELAYLGEITTPSRCGRMDQGCAFGRRPVLMTYDADNLDVEELAVGDDLHLVLVDLRGAKDTHRILAQLNRCFPFAHDEVAAGVQELLGPINERIVAQAIEALGRGDAQRLGSLMAEAQACFDRYAIPAFPGQLAAPILHHVLAYEPLQRHVWGGKGVGSQGDGSAQFIARSPEDQRAAVAILEGELGKSCLTLTIPAQSPPAAVPASGPRTPSIAAADSRNSTP